MSSWCERGSSLFTCSPRLEAEGPRIAGAVARWFFGAHAATSAERHLSHEADRLASRRARRAATAPDFRSAGTVGLCAIEQARTCIPLRALLRICHLARPSGSRSRDKVNPEARWTASTSRSSAASFWTRRRSKRNLLPEFRVRAATSRLTTTVAGRRASRVPSNGGHRDPSRGSHLRCGRRDLVVGSHTAAAGGPCSACRESSAGGLTRPSTPPERDGTDAAVCRPAHMATTRAGGCRMFVETARLRFTRAVGPDPVALAMAIPQSRPSPFVPHPSIWRHNRCSGRRPCAVARPSSSSDGTSRAPVSSGGRRCRRRGARRCGRP